MVRVGVVQMDIAWEDREANFRKVEGFLEQARTARVELLVLPEMFALGFTMNGAAFAEEREGPTTRFLARCAREYGLYIAGACVFRGAEKPRNAALLYSPQGELLARYDKVHPFSMSQEDRYYSAGEQVVVTAALGFNIQQTICYDLRFPELFRAGIERGADLMLVIANWPIEREHHWRFLARARAIDNLSYVVACNRTGEGGGLVYPGASMVVAPDGTVLVNGGREETLYVADLDPAMIGATRRRFPFLRDRKRELYRKWNVEGSDD